MAKRAHTKSTAKYLKTLWHAHKRANGLLSLKQFVRELAVADTLMGRHDAAEHAAAWFANKSANTKAPLKKIGRTNRVDKKKG